MSRRRRKKGLFGFFKSRPVNSRSRGRWLEHFNLSAETKNGIWTIFLFVVGTISLLSIFDLSGEFGRIILAILVWFLGSLKWLFPLIVILFAYFLLRSDKYEVKFINYLGGLLLILGLTSLWHYHFGIEGAFVAAEEGLGGGHIGWALSLPLLKLMSFWGAVVSSLALVLIGLLLIFETSLYGLMWPIRFFKFLLTGLKLFVGWLSAIFKKRSKSEDEGDYEEESGPIDEEMEAGSDSLTETDDEQQPQFKQTEVALAQEEDAVTEPAIAQPKKFGKKIELPLNLLTSRSGKPTSGDIKSIQSTIKKTLANFNINVEMSEVNVGPTVTQYTFRPADGVKLSKIINLNSDLALALAAHPIRIEAPIPGRSLVGVEVPNQLAARVTMLDILNSPEFKKRENKLQLALGKDVSGKPFFSSLDKMPHLLIAGATGSGKSVCINSIIISLLYQNSPDELKFILVDPKRVELPMYNGIPYLLTPVITDAQKTINALKWTIVEMERRFDLLSKKGKRNIESYNQSSSDTLPYIVFIIDELADLMSSSGSDVEAGIIRLAQMSRAVGIHLILATQRPSVEVITGLIKANVPARIAFSVASLVDSRTILDASGAEKLVGRGDMLHLGPGVSKPKRIQGVYLSDKEIKSIIDYIKDQGGAEYIEGVVQKQSAGSLATGGGTSGFDDEDSLLGDAKEVIREAGKASASLLQRRLKIGYARAARILDLLEDRGIIGPADGAKPREVFLDSLGGVDDVVSYAAKEHNLEGELRSEPMTEFIDTPDEDLLDEADDEVEDKDDEDLPVDVPEKNSDDFTDNQVLDLEKKDDLEEVEDDLETEAEEKDDNKDEDLSDDEVVVEEKEKKKNFKADEWS